MTLAALAKLQADKIKLIKKNPGRRVDPKVVASLEPLIQYYRNQREFQKSVKQLEVMFDAEHQNKLFKWLRANLLIDVRNHSGYGKPRATTYTVRQSGFDKLWLRVHGTKFDYVKERARQLQPIFQKLIDAPNPWLLMYTKDEDGRHYGADSSSTSRFYWDGQAAERDVRAVILQGCWDYDIQAAMPTLVLQSVAAKEGLNWRELFPTWARFLGSRRAFRESLADRLGISYEQAKEVCQGMFDLRTFNTGIRGIIEVVGRPKIEKAMADPVLMALRSEASDAWGRIGLEGPDHGAGRFRYYEVIEREVMQTIYESLHARQMRCLPFHDGLVLMDQKTLSEDELAALHAEVQGKTGYSILLEGKPL